jgi:hypothetical protein
MFFRLVQQAVAVEPTTYRSIIDSAKLTGHETIAHWGT